MPIVSRAFINSNGAFSLLQTAYVDICSLPRSSLSWYRFVATLNPRKLNAPITKRDGLVEPLLVCLIERDG